MVLEKKINAETELQWVKSVAVKESSFNGVKKADEMAEMARDIYIRSSMLSRVE